MKKLILFTFILIFSLHIIACIGNESGACVVTDELCYDDYGSNECSPAAWTFHEGKTCSDIGFTIPCSGGHPHCWNRPTKSDLEEY